VVTLSHFSGFAATLEENYLQASFARDAKAWCRRSDRRGIQPATRKSTQANPPQIRVICGLTLLE
jgi:hypothetical protein